MLGSIRVALIPAHKEEDRMSASTTATATGRPPVHDHDDNEDDAATLRGSAADAGREVGATVDTVRAAAGNVGERIPDLIRTVRSGASDGARTIQAWPEPTQRLVAAFSLGLCTGLLLAGAPRLLVGAALLPALAGVASAIGFETTSRRTPA